MPVSVLIFAGVTAAAGSGPPVVSGADKPDPGRILVVSHLTPLPAIQMDRKQLEANWPAFHHEPFERAGFSALALPFNFSSEDGTVDPAYAYAFSFLLSDDLDFAPGSYCSRHAYFVFKRDRERMQPMARQYNPISIAQLIVDWRATHAIGGILTASKTGYGGEVQIFGPDGKVVFTRKYAPPRPFFRLLGDMEVDAMQFFGPAPSAALVDYLHQDRCRHSESLVKLGQAPFMKWRSPEEFKLFDDILAVDPDFAEVRQWSANQKYWDDGNQGKYEIQKALSLQSRVTAVALGDFRPYQCPDRALVGRYPQWVAEFERLAGADAPRAIERHLLDLNVTTETGFSSQLATQGLDAAAKYPNEINLANGLAVYLLARGRTALAGSLELTCINNRFLQATGSRSSNWQKLGDCAEAMGRRQEAMFDWATALTEATGAQESGIAQSCQIKIADMAEQMGQFDEARKAYLEFLETDQNKNDRLRAVVGAGVCAALLGRGTDLSEVRKTYASEIVRTPAERILGAYADLLAGRAVDSESVANGPGGWFPMSDEYQRLLCQLDIAAGKTIWLQSENGDPSDRIAWAILDGYDQRSQPSALDGFSHTLAWLYGDDPWVAATIAPRVKTGARKRVDATAIYERVLAVKAGGGRVLSREEEQPILILLNHLPPWSVADAVHQLLEAGDAVRARRLAERYRDLSDFLTGSGLKTFINRLVAMAGGDKNGM